MIAGYFQSTAGPSNTILICEGVRMLAINSEFQGSEWAKKNQVQ